MAISSEATQFKKKRSGKDDATDLSRQVDYLTLKINGQLFGIPVLQVQDVLRQQRVTHVPLAPMEVDGAMNLRGRIVTAINVRRRLGLPSLPPEASTMSVVVEYESELYSLVIDQVGDVMSLNGDAFEATPATLDPSWREIATGIYRLSESLLVVMDVPKLLRHSVH